MGDRAAGGAVRVVRTRRGVRLIQDGAILSDLRARPGPTHGLFDVLAASVAAFAPGGRCLLLGFAAGGMIAPLRALDADVTIEAVDIDTSKRPLFNQLCGDWAGDVRLHEADAVTWLRRRGTRFDIVVDDLSIPGPEGVTKPAACHETLPRLLRGRLTRNGVALVNLLPVPGLAWGRLTAAVRKPYRRAVAVHLAGYDNRLVVAGDVPDARTAGRRLRRTLRALRSRAVIDVGVRTI